MGGDSHRIVIHVHLACLIIHGRSGVKKNRPRSGRYPRSRIVADTLHLRPRIRHWTVILGTIVGNPRPSYRSSAVEFVLSGLEYRLRLCSDTGSTYCVSFFERSWW